MKKDSQPNDQFPDVCPRQPTDLAGVFDRFAKFVTRFAGSPVMFGVAVLTVLVWAVTGPFMGFSATWQLVINTGTTIVTFLMVFLIQQSQNKDSKAIHVKLDELIISLKGANDRLLDVEELDEKQLQRLEHYYSVAAFAARDNGEENKS